MKLDVSHDIKSLHDRWENGGRFVSIQAGGMVYSLFNHPTRRHWAKATSSFGFHSTETEKPGVWAVAKCCSGWFGGDKTCYGIL